MIFSVSETQTTLFDEITFSGSPSSFAWVLPVKGVVEVGLSADILFASLDALTTTAVNAPPTGCPSPPNCNGGQAGCGASASVAIAEPAVAAPGAGFGVDDEDAGAAAVMVVAQQQVGPYETVQLKSTDPNALTNWLDSHGYVIQPASSRSSMPTSPRGSTSWR
jgi:hypothetical protein